MASDLPWFAFYPKDWLQSTASLTAEQRDAYMTLLCHAWEEHGLPADEDDLRAIGHWSPGAWRRIWSKVGLRFQFWKGRLVHPRMEQEREAAIERRDKLSAAGKAGASKRWPGHTDRTAVGHRPDKQSQSQVHEPPPTPPQAEGRRPTRTERKAALRAVGPTAGKRNWRYDCPHVPECREQDACSALLTAKAEQPDEVPA